MNILVVNWQDIRNPLAGGAEVHLHEVFSRIARRGHRVTLCCSAFPGAPAVEDINGVTVIREGSRSLFNFRFLRAYLARLRFERFDLVVDDMNKIPFFTPLFVHEPVYGITHHLFGRSIFKEVGFLLASYVYMMERLAVWLYRSQRIPFVVGSPSTHRELMECGFRREDVALIHYGVDHAMHTPALSAKSQTPLIGYFGRLKRYKSIDHLLRALPSVARKVPELKAMIVGAGDDRPRLEAIARDLGLQKIVEFTGFVSETRKVELLQKMWFKVATSSKEGWGLTVLEANACGTPVIASNVEGLRDAVRDGETGLLYTYGDVAALSDRIMQLISDVQLRQRLTAAAIEWSRSFDWDVAAEQTLALLERRLESARIKKTNRQ